MYKKIISPADTSAIEGVSLVGCDMRFNITKLYTVPLEIRVDDMAEFLHS
jgi:hypothetical protein